MAGAIVFCVDEQELDRNVIRALGREDPLNPGSQDKLSGGKKVEANATTF